MIKSNNHTFELTHILYKINTDVRIIKIFIIRADICFRKYINIFHTRWEQYIKPKYIVFFITITQLQQLQCVNNTLYRDTGHPYDLVNRNEIFLKWARLCFYCRSYTNPLSFDLNSWVHPLFYVRFMFLNL